MMAFIFRKIHSLWKFIDFIQIDNKLANVEDWVSLFPKCKQQLEERKKIMQSERKITANSGFFFFHSGFISNNIVHWNCIDAVVIWYAKTSIKTLKVKIDENHR